MSVGAVGGDVGAAVRRVNETLQGSVLETLCQFVPDLKAVPRERAYDRVLADLGLLERCFNAFRDQRASFRDVLVDSQRNPVADDQAMLSCGRTLEQVVAMIVRTAAKRHFRRRLNPRPLPGQAKPQRLLDKVAGFLKREQSAAKPAVAAHRTSGKAEELYEALKANLRHEWQVPMVPTYADMSPNLARALGAKLLDITDKDHLRRIIEDPAEAAALFDVADAPAGPSAGAKDQRARLSDILAAGGSRLKLEAFNFALREERLRGLVKSGRRMSLMTEVLSGVCGGAAKILVAELGLRLDQLALVLLVAHEVMGANEFGRCFGPPGDPAKLMRFTHKIRQAGMTQDMGLDRCARIIKDAFSEDTAKTTD